MTTLLEIAETLIARERERHPSLGWTAEHDAGHADELGAAARCYAISAVSLHSVPPRWWPWADDFWKPKGTKLDLIRSGALYLAAEDAEQHDWQKANLRRAYEGIRDRLVLHLSRQHVEPLLAELISTSSDAGVS